MKRLNIFVDETGEFGFGNGASELYGVSFTFHEHNDDIMSELDDHRINFLLKYIENYQSIITTTDSSFVENVDNIKISKVSNGRLEI